MRKAEEESKDIAVKTTNVPERYFNLNTVEEVEEAELDEMWSFVFSKENQRWLWLAPDHQTGQILAYTFGRRKDKVFHALQVSLERSLFPCFILMIGKLSKEHFASSTCLQQEIYADKINLPI